METLNEAIEKLDRRICAIEKRLSDLEARPSSPRRPGKIAFEEPQKVQKPSEPSDNLGHYLAENMAVIGLKEAIKTENRLIRGVWAAMFILAVGATVYYLYQTIFDYSDNPTATSVQLPGEAEHVFPPLQLCPRMWYDMDRVSELGLSENALKYSLSYVDQRFESTPGAASARDEFLTIYNAQKFTTLLDYYARISFDIVPVGQIGTESSQGSLECPTCYNNESLPKTLLKDRLCYAIQLRPMQRLFGAYSGWRTLTIEYPDRSNGQTLDNWDLYFNPIPHSFTSAFPKLSVPPFVVSTVKYTVQKFVSLSRRELPCMESAPKDYHAETCIMKCQNTLYKARANCRLAWLTNSAIDFPPEDTCNYMDRYTPENLTLQQFFSSPANARIDATTATDCVRKCPPRCDRMIYDTTLLVQDRYSESDKAAVLAKNKTVVKVIAKHASVYQGGMIESKEVYSYTFTQLINNIGGTLGLFIGGTLMTVIQLVMAIISYAFEMKRARVVL